MKEKEKKWQFEYFMCFLEEEKNTLRRLITFPRNNCCSQWNACDVACAHAESIIDFAYRLRIISDSERYMYTRDLLNLYHEAQDVGWKFPIKK